MFSLKNHVPKLQGPQVTTTTLRPQERCDSLAFDADIAKPSGFIRDSSAPWSLTVVGTLSAHSTVSESVFDFLRSLISTTVLQCMEENYVEKIRLVLNDSTSRWYQVGYGRYSTLITVLDISGEQHSI